MPVGSPPLAVPVTVTESVTLPRGPMVMELELAWVAVPLGAADTLTHSLESAVVPALLSADVA